MNSVKYIEIFKNGQKEGIRDVTVKRKLQTVRKFLSYLEDAQTDDLLNIDRKNVYEFVNSLDYRSQTISGVQFTLRQFFNIMYEQRLSSFDGYTRFYRQNLPGHIGRPDSPSDNRRVYIMDIGKSRKNRILQHGLRCQQMRPCSPQTGRFSTGM